MIPINYYNAYADHMWRVYIDNLDGNIPNISEPDRANWTACDTVYHSIRPEWQTVTTLHYRRNGDTALRDFCNTNGMTAATVWKIVHAVQKLAAQERGLIPKRTPSDEVMHYGKQNDLKQNRCTR